MDNTPPNEPRAPLNVDDLLYQQAAEQSEVEAEALPTPSPTMNRSFKNLFIRRCVCLSFIVVSILLFVAPCFFVTLMVRGELVFSLSDRPGHEVRLFRLSEKDLGGVGLTWSSLKNETDDGDYCLQTSVKYLVWEGEGENLSYCQCYAKVGNDEWNPTSATEAECPAP